MYKAASVISTQLQQLLQNNFLLMKALFAFLTCILLFASCRNQHNENPTVQTDSVSLETADTIAETEPEATLDSAFIVENYLVSHKSVKNDFVFVTESCGIFIRLDSVQITKLTKEYGEEDLNTIADDNTFYDYRAAEFLEKMHIKSIYPTSRYLKFKINGDTVCMDTKSRFNTQGITILYKTNTLPLVYGSSEIEQAYNNYYR